MTSNRSTDAISSEFDGRTRRQGPTKEQIRRRRIVASIPLLAALVGVVIGFGDLQGEPAPPPSTPIVSLAHKGSKFPSYKVTIGQGGEVSQAIVDFAAAEGDDVSPTKVSPALAAGIVNDVNGLLGKDANAYGGTVPVGTTLIVTPDRPIINPGDLEHTEDPITINRQSSDQR